MNLDDLHYLLAVAEHRNIGRAAESLGLTQPALTRAIRRLEESAGQPLFTRHPKGVEPTAAGTALLARARRIRLEHDDAMQELQQMKVGRLGLLRVGMNPSADFDLFTTAARRLLAERPAARLRLIEGLTQETLELLTDGQIDLLVAPVPTPWPSELESRVLYRDCLYVVADSGHPLCRRSGLTLTDVAAEPWVLPPAHYRVRTLLEQRVAAAGLPALAERVECNSFHVDTFRLLPGTRMLSLCTAALVDAVRRMGLQTLKVEGLDLERDVSVLRRAGSYVAPLSQRFEELLREECAKTAQSVLPFTRA